KRLQDILRNLRFGETAAFLLTVLENAETNDDTHATFLMNVMKYEQKRREEKKSGKTHLAIGLGMKAIYQGYKVIFTTMGEIVQTLKTEEITRKSQTRMKRIRNADLVIIDDLMFMAMDQSEANLLFHLINDLYNTASIILTSNKAPKEWGELLGDPAITTAVLDRILHRVEIIHLNGDSYRMKHRKSIFEEESVTN